jgi:hypothetical protein
MTVDDHDSLVGFVMPTVSIRYACVIPSYVEPSGRRHDASS